MFQQKLCGAILASGCHTILVEFISVNHEK